MCNADSWAINCGFGLVHAQEYDSKSVHLHTSLMLKYAKFLTVHWVMLTAVNCRRQRRAAFDFHRPWPLLALLVRVLGPKCP